MGGAVILTCVAALAVFAVVQDRITAAGVGRYVELHHRAAAGVGGAVTIDEVMEPAGRRALEQGALSGATVLAVGLTALSVVRRSRRRE